MEMMKLGRRCAAVGLVVGLAALLSACFLSPGKFDARLDLKRDGTFRFAYTGQIYILALSELAEAANKAETGSIEFVADSCYDEDYEERACSDEEIAQQKSDWEATLAASRTSADKETAALRGILGGIDPADPEAARELSERLLRQEGWRKVEYKGEGLFDVEFVIDSKMQHDFAFPTFERFPMANFFVMANRRTGNVVRIDAPGFTAQDAGNPFQGVMSGMASVMNEYSGEASEAQQPVPQIEGTFTIFTDGEILANNTDEGPTAGPGGKVLTWKVSKRTNTAPTALIRLAQ